MNATVKLGTVCVVGTMLAAGCGKGSARPSDTPQSQSLPAEAGRAKTASSAEPLGTLADTPDEYLRMVGISTSGGEQRLAGLASASGVIMDTPDDSLFDACQIKTKTKEGAEMGFYVHSVTSVTKSASGPTYKVAYFAVLPGTGGKLGVRFPMSMWLTLKKHGTKWTWGDAIYLSKPKIDSAQIEPPNEGLKVESKVVDSDVHLTRAVLRRAGKTP